MRKLLFLTAAIAAMGFAPAANAGTVTISLGSGSNFDAFDNCPLGNAGCTTETSAGSATLTLTGGAMVADDKVPNLNAIPLGDGTNYVYAPDRPAGSATVAFANTNSVTIYWGSIDGDPPTTNQNTVTLSNGDVVTGAELESTLGALGNGSQTSPKNNLWVKISDTASFDWFKATSTGNSFEFDMAGAVIPEPSTWAMLLLGFSGLGYAAFRRNAKVRFARVPM